MSENENIMFQIFRCVLNSPFVKFIMYFSLGNSTLFPFLVYHIFFVEEN